MSGDRLPEFVNARKVLVLIAWFGLVVSVAQLRQVLAAVLE